MSKTKEELKALKEEVEAVDEKLQELTPEEIAQVTGGIPPHRRGHTYLIGGELSVSKNLASEIKYDRRTRYVKDKRRT